MDQVFLKKLAVSSPEQKEMLRLFPIRAGIWRNIDLWVAVFTKYSTDQIIIHNAEYPDKIYTVLDSNDPPTGLYRIFSDKELEIIDAAKDEIKAILLELDAIQASGEIDPSSLNFGQKVIYGLFTDVPDSSKFARAAQKNNLRAQRGQKDSFAHALSYSDMFDSRVQKILEDAGVPQYLRVLPFIESMYDPNAESRVKAVGPWQIMGTKGLKINDSVDHRKDPIFSAQAAAKKLAGEHESLRKLAVSLGIDTDKESLWPLTIIAYNFGITRAREALRKLKTTDAVTIIQEYSHRYKGFAVSNFYPKFLAALQVYTNRDVYFPDLKHTPSIDDFCEELILTSNIGFSELAREYGTDADSLTLLNPFLSGPVRLGYKDIPRETLVRVPMQSPESGANIEIARFAKFLPIEDKVIFYTVQENDTLSGIAARYSGVSWKDIQEFNRLHSPKAIKPNQVLIIPRNF